MFLISNRLYLNLYRTHVKTGDQARPESQSRNNDNPVRIWVDLRISNGLHLSQKNLSYQDLVRMVENLEGVC